MDEIIFDYPEPLMSDGIFSDGASSDYNLTTKPFEIRIFNDNKPDGDSLLMLELKPKASGMFGTGFAQDFYSFKESAALREKTSNDGDPISSEFAYVAPITTALGSPIHLAVVLIQDNEKEQNGSLRRTILGSGNNILTFFDNKDDTILAGAGKDVIRSGGGNDIIFGEAGDDELDGGAGNDYLFGNSGNDRLFGREGNDWLDGGLGNDLLAGGTGNDTYAVDSSEDQIIDIPGTGIETVRASVNWTLQIGLEHLFLTGGARVGNGNSLDNFIRGNNLGNTIEGGDGNDTIFGDELASRLFGGNFKKFVAYEDFFQAEAEFEGDPLPNLSTLAGYQELVQLFYPYPGFGTPPPGGDDILKGGNGDDKLFGWAGNDTLYGEADNDWLFGGYGNDWLFGGEGNDLLDGENGNDWLFGGFGDDLLAVSDGNDFLVGGFGADKFRFDKKPTQGKTSIQDFTPGQDLIEISKSAFGNPVLSQFSFSPLVGNERHLLFNGQQLATVRSSSTSLSISQSVKLI